MVISSEIIMGVREGDAPIVTGNRTSYTCGGWYLTNGSSLTMRYGAEISDNSALGLAGGVGAQQSTISMYDGL